MKIVVAFDSFKGCMTASEACQSAAEGARRRWPDAEVVQIPLSDGGEGLVKSIVEASQLELSSTSSITSESRRASMASSASLRLVSCPAHGPLMEPIEAHYALSADGRTAYMEMAETSGLTLVSIEKRNPLLTTTYGVGEMIDDAVRRGVCEIVMGIGGSATNDGGRGMVEYLFSIKQKAPLSPKGCFFCRQTAKRHCRADAERARSAEESTKSIKGFDPMIDVTIRVACDVDNPLLGERGATRVFGPQKGATPEMLDVLEERMNAWEKETVEAGYATPELAEQPGTGAAGGLGYALVAYLGATLQSGIDILMNIVHFDEQIQGADLIITGEGKSDRQTLMGKVPFGVLRHAIESTKLKAPLGDVRRRFFCRQTAKRHCRADAERARSAEESTKNHDREKNIPVWLLSGAIEDEDGLLASHFDVVRSINEGDTHPLPYLMRREVAMQQLARTVESLELRD